LASTLASRCEYSTATNSFETVHCTEAKETLGLKLRQ
jgi:hypothetical protein